MSISNENISAKEFEIISSIGRDIIATLEIHEVIERIYININMLMDAQIFAIAIYKEAENEMDFWGIKDNGKLSNKVRKFNSDDKYWTSYCFNQQKEIFVTNPSEDKEKKLFSNLLFDKEKQNRNSFIFLPLSIQSKRLGILTVQAYQANTFSEKHFQIVKTLASYISIAIVNASNFQKIKEQNIAIKQQNEKLENINKELERLSIVARQTENAIMIMDAQGNVLWINVFFTKLYEYTYEQFTSMRGQNIRDTSFNPEIDNILNECVQQKKAICYEALNKTVSGKEIWTQTTLTPIFNTQGNIEHLVTIDTDITKRKIAENEILKQKERIELQAKRLEENNEQLEKLSIVARKTENAIMLMDAKGNILWINDYFTKIYEYSLDHFKTIRGQNILNTSFNPNIEKALNRCIEYKEAVTYEALNITISGKQIWTQTTLTPILNSKGVIKNLVTIDSDVTKRKKAEAKINIQNKNITDSIKYARRIQEAILPAKSAFKAAFKDYMIYYKPKNIVSGDFYWLRKVVSGNKELIILVVADCTGHGVPGAFVSMLGISLISDIVAVGFRDGKSLSAADIIEKLRLRIKKTLNQNGTDHESKDGMDLALCIIDPQLKKIQYSGANNPMYIVRNGGVKGTHLEVLKPTKNPVGIHYREKRFELKEINYNNNDLIYMFSDGIIDQFGGENKRKFMARNLRHLILNISPLDLSLQKEKIEKTMNDWRGKIDQIDDILVIGVKL